MRKLTRLGSILMLLVLIVPVVKAAAPYATFDYDGRHYYVSAAYEGGNWYEAKRFCASLTWNGGGWRLPTLEETRAMRTEWNGNDPFLTTPDCPESEGGELWTSTGCPADGAYEVHRLEDDILCDVSGYCECDPVLHTCCIHKYKYRLVHFCPVARCVQPQEQPPTPVPTPKPPPGCQGDFVEPWGERDFHDLLQWLKYVQAGDLRADVNGDGEVDEEDGDLMLYFIMRDPMCPGEGSGFPLIR